MLQFGDKRLHFPHTVGNREPIWAVLSPLLQGPPSRGAAGGVSEAGDPILEVASGSGEHIHCFASKRPELQWIPSDREPLHVASVDAWCEGLPNVARGLPLDVSAPSWPVLPRLQAVVAVNLIHISPWEACCGLLDGAARALAPGGWLYFYGAFKRNGAHTAPSNVAFDRGLRQQDPSWGVRDREGELLPAAAERGFALSLVVDMPSNNFSVILALTGGPTAFRNF